MNATTSTPEVLLQMTADALVLTQGAQSLRLAVSSQAVAARHFRGALPGPVEMEYAIQDIEDALQAGHHRFGGARLSTQDASFSALPAFAGKPAAAALTREEVEACFSRLAALSLGRPQSQDPLPDDPLFAATLLVLRELMHHLDFATIRVAP